MHTAWFLPSFAKQQKQEGQAEQAPRSRTTTSDQPGRQRTLPELTEAKELEELTEAKVRTLDPELLPNKVASVGLYRIGDLAVFTKLASGVSRISKEQAICMPIAQTKRLQKELKFEL
jgi:hypothetical protein